MFFAYFPYVNERPASTASFSGGIDNLGCNECSFNDVELFVDFFEHPLFHPFSSGDPLSIGDPCDDRKGGQRTGLFGQGGGGGGGGGPGGSQSIPLGDDPPLFLANLGDSHGRA